MAATTRLTPARTRLRRRGAGVGGGGGGAAGGGSPAPGGGGAARQPAAPRPTWLVVGVDADGAAALADRLLFELAEAAGGFGGTPRAAGAAVTLGFDFLV